MVVCMTVRKLFLKWKLDLALKFHGSAGVPFSSLSTLSLSGPCPHPRIPPLCYLFSNTSHGQNGILIFSLQILPDSLNLIFHQTPVTQTPHLLMLPSVVNTGTSWGKSSLVIIFPLSYLHAKIILIYLLLSNFAFKAPTLESKPPCSLAGIPSGIFPLESLLLSCCSLCQSSHSSQKEPVLNLKDLKKKYGLILKSILNLVQRCFYLMFWLFSWELCEILAPCVLCSVAQSCPALCNPMGCVPQALCPWDSPGKLLEWVAISSSRGSSQPRDWPRVSCVSRTGRRIYFFTTESPGKTSSSLTSVQTHTPCIGGRSPNHWTTREVPTGTF